MRSPASPLSLLSWGFLKLALGFFFCCLCLSLFALVPYFLELRGESELMYGAAAGMHGFGGVAAMALFGARADQGSRRRASVGYFGATLVANAVALLAMDAHALAYVVAMGLQGVTVGLGLPVMFVWASELMPPRHRTEAFAWLGMAGLAADGLGPVLAEALLHTQALPRDPGDFRVVFIAANVLSPVALCFLWWAPDVSPPTAAGPSAQPSQRGFFGLLSRPPVRASLACSALFGGAFGVMLGLGKNFVASIGLDLVSVLLGAHTVGAVAARLFLPWLLTRVQTAWLVPRGLASVAAAMGLLAMTDDYMTLAAAGLLYGCSHGVLFPSLLSRLVDYGGEDAAGRLATLNIGLFSFGYGLMPTLGGAVLRVSNYSVLFSLTAVGCLVAVFLSGVAERLHRRGVPKTP